MVVIVVLGDWCRKVVGLEVDEDCDGVVKPQPNLKENGAGSIENSMQRKWRKETEKKEETNRKKWNQRCTNMHAINDATRKDNNFSLNLFIDGYFYSNSWK